MFALIRFTEDLQVIKVKQSPNREELEHKMERLSEQWPHAYFDIWDLDKK